MKEEFNVKNPTKENIDYAFKNLIYYVNASINLEEYQKYQELLNNILVKINKILSIYVNSEDLLKISEDLLQEVRYDLIDLDVETKNLKSYNAEWSLLWLDAIISLKNTIMEGLNNGK